MKLSREDLRGMLLECVTFFDGGVSEEEIIEDAVDEYLDKIEDSLTLYELDEMPED